MTVTEARNKRTAGSGDFFAIRAEQLRLGDKLETAVKRV
jgi:hypothetical protein